jgi:hypothetical protein
VRDGVLYLLDRAFVSYQFVVIRGDPTNPAWAKMQDASVDVLRKKFEAIKKPIIELIQRMVAKPI